MTPLESFKSVARQILEGDASKQAAGDLERILVDSFVDTTLYEELSEILALYDPGVGSPYVDAPELRERLGCVLEDLDSLI